MTADQVCDVLSFRRIEHAPDRLNPNFTILLLNGGSLDRNSTDAPWEVLTPERVSIGFVSTKSQLNAMIDKFEDA